MIKKVMAPVDEVERGPGRPVLYPDGCRFDNEPSRFGGLCKYHGEWSKRNQGEDPANAPERLPRVCPVCSRPVQIKRILVKNTSPRQFKDVVTEHRRGSTRGPICEGTGRVPRPRPKVCGKRGFFEGKLIYCKRPQHAKPMGRRNSWHRNTIEYVEGVSVIWRRRSELEPGSVR